MNSPRLLSLRLIAVVGLGLLALVPASVSQQFPFVLAVRHAINLNGNDILSDSYDSSNPTKSTNGWYDASKYTGDFGDVAAGDSIVVGVGSVNIYGKLHIRPGGGVSLGSYGGVGTHAWRAANGGGMEPGYFLKDANYTLPDTSLPTNTDGYLTPQPGDVVVRLTNSVAVTNHYDNVLYAGTHYVSSALTGSTIVLGPNVTLVLPNGLTGAENLFFYYTDYLNSGLTIYAGGISATINGNHYINPSGRGASLIIICASSVISFTLNGNGHFTGVLVAPNADLTLNGGGSSHEDFCGSLRVNSVTMHCSFGFHNDENLSQILRYEPWVPSFTTQPQNRTVTVGQPATFTVSVIGCFPLGCQWQLGGTNIPNATESSFTIPSASMGDAGIYSVIVTNECGSAVSSNAVLTVIAPPTLTLQLGAGYPLLNLNGMLSSNFVVQFCTNLERINWIDLVSLTNLQASPYPILDAGRAGQPARFYRAFMQ